MQKITILITDDHVMVRQAWSHILNDDPRFSVVGQCSSVEEAVELARQLRPDVIIMDIILPGISEREVIEYLKKGYSSREIAGTLNVAVKTVEVHRYNILKKLDLNNTAELMEYVNKNFPAAS